MSLPNYSPEGTILLGCVPWNSNYAHVRLYTSLTEQQEDISSLMTISTTDYVYIGRNRRLKVNIVADRLYHINYCMYQNASIGTGWIYCFVTDVRYINDNTTQLTLETDIFQTYLMNVDWTIPSCYVQRETVADDDDIDSYAYTSEADVPLIYEEGDINKKIFLGLGYGVLTSAEPKRNDDIIESIINPSGYYADPIDARVMYGVPQGCSFYFCPLDDNSRESTALQQLLKEMTYAGSTESIVTIFTVPVFLNTYNYTTGFQVMDDYDEFLKSDEPSDTMRAPGPVTESSDGYQFRNKKLQCYPYQYVSMTDHSGSSMELRYEMWDDYRYVRFWYAPTGECKCLVTPYNYGNGLDESLVMPIQCGMTGSWNNQVYGNWLAQNAAKIIMTVGGAAISAVAGSIAYGDAFNELQETSNSILNAKHMNYGGSHMAPYVDESITSEYETAMNAASGVIGGAGATIMGAWAQQQKAFHQASTTQGTPSPELMYVFQKQGLFLENRHLIGPVAKMLDTYFDAFGYEVDTIKEVNVTSRPVWNYVKTSGCTPRSANVVSSTTAPVSRGRGTPADVLATIGQVFDNGVTFWHTTTNFGDRLQDNTV